MEIETKGPQIGVTGRYPVSIAIGSGAGRGALVCAAWANVQKIMVK